MSVGEIEKKDELNMKVKPNRMLASDELNMIWYVCIYFHSVHSNLVISVLSDVANPW